MAVDYSQHVYFLNTDTRNKINNGVKMIVDKSPGDVSSIDDFFLYTKIKEEYDQKKIESLYEVGFGFGQHMINVKKLCPKMRIGGCELSPEYLIYANNYFNLGDYDFQFDIGHILDLDVPKYDVVLCDNLIGVLPDNERKLLIDKLLTIADKYILVADNVFNFDTATDMYGVLTTYEAPSEIIETTKYLGKLYKMQVSSLSYEFPLDGNCTESLTLDPAKRWVNPDKKEDDAQPER